MAQAIPSLLRPYSAKAIILHEWDTDHLNIWIIFRYKMDQSAKPLNWKWLVETDDSAKAIVNSTWQDDWTMLLEASAVASLPERVTVAYDGPDPDLKIKWQKQWEPWGPILSSGKAGLPVGSFKGNEINWQQAAAQNVWYTISDANISAGVTRQTVFQNDQEIRVQKAGVYLVVYYVSVECSIAGKHVLTSPGINGVEQPDGQTHHEFGRANEEESWAGAALFNLALDDKISVEIATSDAGNPNLTVNHVGSIVTYREGT